MSDMKRAPSQVISMVLTAALLMSPFGWQKYLLIGGQYLPELAAIPLAALSIANGDKTILNALAEREFKVWTSICLLLLLVGILFHHDPVAAYTDFRNLFALGLAYSISKQTNILSENSKSLADLIILCLAFNILAAFVLPKNIASVKSSFPVAATLVGVYICAARGWAGRMLIVFALGSYLAFTSFFRQNIAITALAIPVMLISTQTAKTKDGHRNMWPAIAMTGATASAFVLSPVAIGWLFNYIRASESRYIQSIGKTRDLLAFLSGNGAASQGDLGRLAYPQFMVENLYYFLLPSGLGFKAWGLNWRSMWMPENSGIYGSSLDGGYLYLAMHFGIIASTLLVIHVSSALIKKWMKSTPLSVISDIFFLGALALYTFASTPFTQMSYAITYGLALGLLVNRSISVRRSNA